jgi:hypothetical protein
MKRKQKAKRNKVRIKTNDKISTNYSAPASRTFYDSIGSILPRRSQKGTN